jgi:hypothetical protein
MSLHHADIQARLGRFLDRKQMPRRLEGKPAAQTDEIQALSRVIARFAPRDPAALAAWWPAFEAGLGLICGAMWPTEKEAADAGKQAVQAQPRPEKPDGEHSLDPAALTAAAMAEGKPVGESWLWGVLACDLIATGLVDRETMTRYRSAAFHRRKAVQGEESALAWEAEAKERHEAAKAMRRDKDRQPRDVAVPDLTAPNKSVAFA